MKYSRGNEESFCVKLPADSFRDQMTENPRVTLRITSHFKDRLFEAESMHTGLN